MTVTIRPDDEQLIAEVRRMIWSRLFVRSCSRVIAVCIVALPAPYLGSASQGVGEEATSLPPTARWLVVMTL
jgi:hypothetical protein